LTFLERRHFDEAEGQSLLEEADLENWKSAWKRAVLSVFSKNKQQQLNLNIFWIILESLGGTRWGYSYGFDSCWSGLST